MSNRPLKVLNASAGSGKTYSLVNEYVLLLLDENVQDHKFSEIIAMTFTNKAALEMKTRIIQKLDLLAHTTSEDSERSAIELGEILGISSVEIQVRAKEVLHAILHRYEDFHVMTIDKFNLKLIRSFSRDLDIAHDFEIILNEDVLIEQVVDKMLSQLGHQKELTNLVFKYAQSKIEEGEKWSFRNSLINFAKILRKEQYFPFIEQLHSIHFSADDFKSLKSELRTINDDWISLIDESLTLIHNLGISEQDLPLKGALPKKLNKFKSTGLNIGSKEFFTSNQIETFTSEPGKGKIFPIELQNKFYEILETYDRLRPKYEIHRKYLQNYFNMALLQYLSETLKELRSNEQLVRISEFNAMISELVSQEDAPFIYERLGTRFHHFLLDEFQDTSRLQWLNMTPLIHESISNQRKNLIVGDPKQSIYRFKNGVAEQFVALPSLYNPEKDSTIAQRSSYFESMGKLDVLENNWRSSSIIVDFNNSYFTKIVELLTERNKAFYQSVQQQPKSSKEGYVEFISHKAESKDEASRIQYIIDTIEKCENQGFQRGDICILGPKNKDCRNWAKELTDRGYKVVSVDSLSMENDSIVRMLIAYFKTRLNPTSQNEFKQFAEVYCRVNQLGVEKYTSYFDKRISKKGKEYTVFNSERFINDNFSEKERYFFVYESLYDLVQQSFELFHVDELQNPYVHHLADLIHSFELAKGPDLQSFLQEYNIDTSNLAVQIPESSDAIQIMTIHKSKGLEFPVVIIPSLDLNTDSQSDFLIPTDHFLLFTRLGKNSPIEAIRAMTNQENEQILLDNVNLLYVGMTRPIERLYIYNVYNKSKFGAFVHKNLGNTIEEEQEEIIHQIGQETIRKQYSNEEQEDQFFEPSQPEDHLWFPDIALQDRPELTSSEALSDEQLFGNQFHLAISRIHTKAQLENGITQLIQEGEIELRFKEKITEQLLYVLDSPHYQELFSDVKELLYEQSIIANSVDVLRPDVIVLKDNETLVIDYKTGIPKEKDIKQVNAYKAILEAMNYPQVQGCIFYTYDQSVRFI